MRSLLILLLAASVSSLSLAAAEPPHAGGGYHFLLAKSLAEEGRFREAIAELDAAQEVEGPEPYLLLERAGLLMQMGRLGEASESVARSRSLLPENLDALRLQGRIELARSEEVPAAIEIARDALERLIEERPDDLEVLLSLGQIYLSSGLAHRAVEMLEKAARLRPNHPWIESMRARALAAAGETDSSDQVKRALLEHDPNDLVMRFELVDRLGQEGRHLEAVELLRGAPTQQHRRLDFREREARELFLSGDPESALAQIEGVVAESGERVGPRLLLANIRIVLGYFDLAEEMLATLPAGPAENAVTNLRVRALEGGGRFGAAAALLEERLEPAWARGDGALAATMSIEISRLWGRAGDWDRASSAAREAGARTNGSVAETLRRIEARALVAGGRADEALALVSAGEPLPPERAALRIELLMAANRLDEAEAEAQRLLASWPGAPLAVGGAFQDHQEFERALPLLERALAEAPTSLEALFRLATCYERVGRTEEAMERLKVLVERAPRFTPALNYLGYLWIERSENLDEALRLVSDAVRLEPDNGAYVDSLGWGEYQRGGFGRAVQLLERAERLQPHDPTILEHLGDARVAAGDAAGALEAYRRALELGPPTAAALEAKISQLDGKQ